MALRIILRDGDPALRKKSRAVTEFDERLHVLLDDMRETLTQAEGAGLAAPQVGILRRVAIVIDGNGDFIELINPEIVTELGLQDGPEGCLSLPGVFGMVERPMQVVVKAFDRNGEPFTTSGFGLMARAFCHEVDHLEGRFFTEIVTRYLTDEEIAALADHDGSDGESEIVVDVEFPVSGGES